MPFTVSLLESAPIVLTEYVGRLRPAEVREAAMASIALGKEHGILRYLGDCRLLPVETGAVLDIYELVELFESMGLDRRMREALVIAGPARPREDLDFYETVAKNRGFNVRIFDDMEAARAWLMA